MTGSTSEGICFWCSRYGVQIPSRADRISHILPMACHCSNLEVWTLPQSRGDGHRSLVSRDQCWAPAPASRFRIAHLRTIWSPVPHHLEPGYAPSIPHRKCGSAPVCGAEVRKVVRKCPPPERVLSEYNKDLIFDRSISDSTKACQNGVISLRLSDCLYLLVVLVPHYLSCANCT